MTPILETRGLSHVYSVGTPFEHTAIEHIDLCIAPGEFVGLIGHTGSGKSTLIQHLNALLKPTAGEVLFHGEDIWRSTAVTRQARFQIGLVFQYPEYQLFEETVYREIAFGPKNQKLSDDEIRRRVLRAAQFVGLDQALLEQSPFDLSGGQKRRIAIAGVIAMEPEVLILDEPTAGLDPLGSAQILENIRSYQRAQNAAIVMVTHNMEQIAELADRLIVMDHGTVAMQGTPREVFSRSAELEKMGLAVPQINRVVQRLRERGVAIDPGIFTLTEALSALQKLKGGAADA